MGVHFVFWGPEYTVGKMDTLSNSSMFGALIAAALRPKTGFSYLAKCMSMALVSVAAQISFLSMAWSDLDRHRSNTTTCSSLLLLKFACVAIFIATISKIFPSIIIHYSEVRYQSRTSQKLRWFIALVTFGADIGISTAYLPTGVFFIMTQDSMESLVLAAAAMQFVINIDELLYECLPQDATDPSKEAKDSEPISMEEGDVSREKYQYHNDVICKASKSSQSSIGAVVEIQAVALHYIQSFFPAIIHEEYDRIALISRRRHSSAPEQLKTTSNTPRMQSVVIFYLQLALVLLSIYCSLGHQAITCSFSSHPDNPIPLDLHVVRFSLFRISRAIQSISCCVTLPSAAAFARKAHPLGLGRRYRRSCHRHLHAPAGRRPARRSEAAGPLPGLFWPRPSRPPCVTGRLIQVR